MAISVMDTPPSGEFPIYLGNTFEQPQQDPAYWSLRYDFKPASMNTDAPGVLSVGPDGQVSLDVLNKSAGQGDLEFSGHFDTFDGLDCVAVFDGVSWQLQLLTGSLRVRHVKGQSRLSPGPQAVPAATHEAARLLPPPSATTSSQAEGQDQTVYDMSQQASTADDEDMASVSDATDDDDPQDDAAQTQQQAQQSIDTAMARPQANLQQQLHTNGHLHPSPDAQQSSDESEASTEDDDEDAAAVHQEAHVQQAPPANEAAMTDLERQFFANSQPPSSDSSESSSDSDQESLNHASEDDDDDGLDHF